MGVVLEGLAEAGRDLTVKRVDLDGHISQQTITKAGSVVERWQAGREGTIEAAKSVWVSPIKKWMRRKGFHVCL